MVFCIKILLTVAGNSNSTVCRNHRTNVDVEEIIELCYSTGTNKKTVCLERPSSKFGLDSFENLVRLEELPEVNRI